MQLGAFSISLAVEDIKASKDFYEKFGFQVFHSDITQNWLILKNDDTTIGIFQGMFENYIMTFNPGWDSDANELEKFTDIR
jgi:predicted lactoylglutathione lyase